MSEGVGVGHSGEGLGAAAWCGCGFGLVWACAFGGSLGPRCSGRCCQEGQKLMQIRETAKRGEPDRELRLHEQSSGPINQIPEQSHGDGVRGPRGPSPAG